MIKNAASHFLEQRQGKEIHDEDTEAYLLGFRDALTAMVSDETYYGAHGGKPGKHAAVQAAVAFVENENYAFPQEEDDE